MAAIKATTQEIDLREELTLQTVTLNNLNQRLVGRIPSGVQYRSTLAEIAKTEIKIKQLEEEIKTLELARKPKKAILATKLPKITPNLVELNEPNKQQGPLDVVNLVSPDVVNVNLTAAVGERQIMENGDTVIVYTEDSGAVNVTDEAGNLIISVAAPADPQPTTFGTGVAQGNIEGSIIAVTNKKRTHECDISLFVMKEKALAGIAMKIVKELRTAIAAIIAFFGINPGSSGIIETIKQIKAWVDDIREFLEDVVLKIAEYLAIVQKIGALIQYILSLPAEILAYFKSCLTQLYAELKRQFLDAVAAVSDEFSTGDNDTINEAKKLLASTKKLIQQTASTVQVVQSLPAATLSKITNPGTAPLTMEEAGNLAKDLLPTPLTTTKYEAA
jgi:hypothetical protein